MSISPCFAQGNRDASQEMPGLGDSRSEITTPFKCDSLDPKVCFDGPHRASRKDCAQVARDPQDPGGARAADVGHRAARPAAKLIEHDGEDLRARPFLERKAALAWLLSDTGPGILLNEHIAEDGTTVFAHACRLGPEGIVSKKVDGAYQSGPCRVWIKVRNPASIAVQRERSEIWNRRALGSTR
jgi:hypothetical protein